MKKRNGSAEERWRTSSRKRLRLNQGEKNMKNAVLPPAPIWRKTKLKEALASVQRLKEVHVCDATGAGDAEVEICRRWPALPVAT